LQPMAATTWILTSSPENHAASASLDFSLIGIKERNRSRAEQIEPGDRIVLYLTRKMSFAGSITVKGPMFEDRTPIWPGKKGNPDIYPWRFETRPELRLEEQDWIPAESLSGDLHHVGKWPAEHWRLAFQGQIRAVDQHDAELLVKRLKAASSG